MTVKPEVLWDDNRLEISNNILEIEKTIDDHLYKYYTHKGCDVPLLQIEEPLELVKNSIIKKYNDAGWNIKFIKEIELGQVSIYLKEFFL